MQKYIIYQAQATGNSHQTYGNEYYVKFEGDDQTYKLWYQKEPTPGQEQYGTISDGWKFKKASKQELEAAGQQPAAPKFLASNPNKRDNSDGQRQGMCINNAANYVNELGEFTTTEWATRVHAYASALYALGDLTAEPAVTEVPLAEAPQSVKDVFGPSPANK